MTSPAPITFVDPQRPRLPSSSPLPPCAVVTHKSWHRLTWRPDLLPSSSSTTTSTSLRAPSSNNSFRPATLIAVSLSPFSSTYSCPYSIKTTPTQTPIHTPIQTPIPPVFGTHFSHLSNPPSHRPPIATLSFTTYVPPVLPAMASPRRRGPTGPSHRPAPLIPLNPPLTTFSIMKLSQTGPTRISPPKATSTSPLPLT